MRLCRASGANVGKAGYGTSTIAVQGAIPASQTGVEGGNVQWLSGASILFQSMGVGGASAPSLVSLVVATDTPSTADSAGANDLGAGGGVWGAWLAGSGFRSSVGGLGPFPDATIGYVSAEGQTVVIDDQQLGAGLTVYDSSGNELLALAVTLTNPNVRLVDDILAYQDASGWHLVDVTDGTTPQWAPRLAPVGLLIPFYMGSTLWVLESQDALTLRQATRAQGYIIEDQPIFFSPDAMALSATEARIGYCTNQGESVTSLILVDLDVANGVNEVGTVVGSTVVFAEGDDIAQTPMPVGPMEGSSLAGNFPDPPNPHPITQSGRLLGTPPWTTWFSNVAQTLRSIGAFAQGTAASGGGGSGGGSSAGPSFGSILVPGQPPITPSAPNQSLTITSADGSIAVTTNPITRMVDLAVVSAPSSWIPLVDGSEPPNFITDGAGNLILVAYTP